MLQFPIWWRITSRYVTYHDERNSQIARRELDNEWTIVFVLGAKRYPSPKFVSLEIHRKNTTEECSVSGELRLKPVYGEPFEKKFSHSIEAGSSFIEIASIRNQNMSIVDSVFIGHVYVSDRRERHATNSADGESKERIQLKSLQELSKDLERILNPESSCFTDVTLKCVNVSIPAHKIILSARSPVFAAMFANPMKERFENEVDITDVDESVLRDLLKYLYTGKTSDLTVESAANLLFAADKYQIQDLKAVCTYFLKTSVSLHTVWKILVVGDLLSEDLKSFAVDYVCSNSGEFSVIKNSREFKALRKERPELAMDLLESLVQSMDEKLKHLYRRKDQL